MAVALVGTPAGGSGGAGGAGLTSLTTSLTLDAAATMLVAHIGLVHGGATRTVSSVTYAAASLAQVSGAARTNTVPYGDTTSDLWYLASPATGANNLVTTPSAGCAAICHGVSGWSGDDGTVTGGDGATGSGDPATKSVTTTSGQVVVGVICAYAGFPGASANITSNNTLLFEVENHSQEDDVTNAAYDAGSSPTMSWENDASDQWSISVAILSPAGASGAMVAALTGGGTSAGTLTGSGALTAAPTGTGALAGTLGGSGAAAAGLTGSGTLDGTLAGTGALTSALTGTGALTGTFSGTAPIAADLSGGGTLAGTLTGAGALAAGLSGTGSITATLVGERTVAFTGTAVLSGTLTGAGVLAAALTGTGTLTGAFEQDEAEPVVADQVQILLAYEQAIIFEDTVQIL